jgi:hypothetical protein
MKVRQAEQLLFPAREPSLACLRLTLWTVPIPAGVEREGRLTAPGTLIQMAAQSRRAAALNGAQHFQLLIAEPRPVLGNQAITLRAKSVGHLDGGPAHSGLCNFRERSKRAGPETAIRPSGSVAACKRLGDTCR